MTIRISSRDGSQKSWSSSGGRAPASENSIAWTHHIASNHMCSYVCMYLLLNAMSVILIPSPCCFTEYLWQTKTIIQNYYSILVCVCAGVCLWHSCKQCMQVHNYNEGMFTTAHTIQTFHFSSSRSKPPQMLRPYISAEHQLQSSHWL